MSKNYDNWERLVTATLLREKLRQLSRQDSLSSFSSSESSWSFREFDSPILNLSKLGLSFSYQQILVATSFFSDRNLIKRGSSGDLFVGQLSEPVVIKRVKFHNRGAFSLELGFLSRISINPHPRFVPLLGHCLEVEDEKCLVYRYLPYRDLSNSLFKKNDDHVDGLISLDWITRWKIARGVAEALVFLHHECNPPLVHGDLQATSILLDRYFEVRLGSLSQVSPLVDEFSVHTDQVTFDNWKSSKGKWGMSKTTRDYDIYSFGKVLLELITGKLDISSSTHDDATMNEWLDSTLSYISVYEKERITYIVDPSLVIDDDLLDEVWAMAILAKSCLNPKPTIRPLMRYVLKALENPMQVVRDEKRFALERQRNVFGFDNWGNGFGSDEPP